MECSWSLRYKGDHGGTFFQGNCFPAAVTAADNVVWSSAVCASDFCNEDDGTRGEQVGKLDAIYQEMELASRYAEPSE
jgi:hypothetical protein